MSYSFSIRAPRQSIYSAVSEKLAEVVKSQPVHEIDKQPTLDAVDAFLGVLDNVGDDEQVSVQLVGSVVLREAQVRMASVSLNVSIVAADQA